MAKLSFRGNQTERVDVRRIMSFWAGVVVFTLATTLASVVTAKPAAALSPTIGWLDQVTNVAPGRWLVSGWAVTSDHPTAALGVRIRIAGRVLDPDHDLAAGYRPDVAAAYPGYGDWHGYGFIIAVPPVGTQTERLIQKGALR